MSSGNANISSSFEKLRRFSRFLREISSLLNREEPNVSRQLFFCDASACQEPFGKGRVSPAARHAARMQAIGEDILRPSSGKTAQLSFRILRPRNKSSVRVSLRFDQGIYSAQAGRIL